MHALTTHPCQDSGMIADRDLLADAVANLQDVWGDLAPAEALTRALVAERTENRDMAFRWTQVYLACIKRN